MRKAFKALLSEVNAIPWKCDCGARCVCSDEEGTTPRCHRHTARQLLGKKTAMVCADIHRLSNSVGVVFGYAHTNTSTHTQSKKFKKVEQHFCSNKIKEENDDKCANQPAHHLSMREQW